jgi:hypothetical protein
MVRAGVPELAVRKPSPGPAPAAFSSPCEARDRTDRGSSVTILA